MAKNKELITFKQLYKDLRDSGYTSQHIIEEIAEVTKTSTATVRNWVYTDRVPQSALVSHAIASHYNVAVEGLFPGN